VIFEKHQGRRAQPCDRLATLRTKYIHNPRFPSWERHTFPMSIAKLISEVERPRNVEVYCGPGTLYDPELFTGNLAAAPPETLRGALLPGASDVYGVAVLLWWMLTGEESPFEIDISGERAEFVGWAFYYRQSSEEQLAFIRSNLERNLLSSLAAQLSKEELRSLASWLCSALAEAPERRPRAGPPLQGAAS